MRAASAGVTVKAVTDRRGRRDWLRVPYTVFADDPAWVAPLLMQEKRRISRKHNPFFSFGDAELFIAYRQGRPVGRISAQISRRHQQHHNDGAGHFGFFDCLDDSEAAGALVAAAAAWLEARGARRMIGPLSFTINEEVGLPVSGFDIAPGFLTPHARPWSGRLLEETGLRKAIDLFAYRVHPGALPAQIKRLDTMARASGRIAVREFDMSRFREEVHAVIDIFNDAWSDNWGFVPFSDAEIDALIAEMRYVLRGYAGRIVTVDGEPAAMMIGLPDINDVIAPFRGHLLPFNWMKLGVAFWRENWRGTRVPLLGIRKRYRGTPLAAGMLAMLVSQFVSEARDYPFEWLEFSWVLETNRAMIAIAELAAGKPVKTYRIYQRDIPTVASQA